MAAEKTGDFLKGNLEENPNASLHNVVRINKYMNELGINKEKDTIELTTSRVGGSTKVYFLKARQQMKIGDWERSIPIGFLDDTNVPPLFGRHECTKTFKVLFYKLETTIDS